MKKRIIMCMLAIMMVAATAITIESCKKDEDRSASSSSSSSGPGDTSQVTGTWSGNFQNGTLTLVINSNGTGTATFVYTNSSNVTQTQTTPFDYTMSDSYHGTAIVSEPGSSPNTTNYYIYRFEIIGTNLVIYQQGYNGNEVIGTLTKI